MKFTPNPSDLLKIVQEMDPIPPILDFRQLLSGGSFFLGKSKEVPRKKLLATLPLKVQSLLQTNPDFPISFAIRSVIEIASSTDDQVCIVVVSNFQFNYIGYYEAASQNFLGMLRSRSNLGKFYERNTEQTKKLFSAQSRHGDWYQDEKILWSIP